MKRIRNLSQTRNLLSKLVVSSIMPLVVVLLLLTSIRVVGTGTVGVVTRFGQVTGRELGEGIHLVMPLGIERANMYDIKIQKQTEQAASASKDLQDVTSTLTLNYRLQHDRVGEMHQTVGTDYRLKLIEPALQEVFKASSAKFSAQELISQRDQVKKDTFTLLKDRLEKFGIIVDDLSIVDFTFSDTFTKAIEEKQVAEQNAQRAKFNLEAAKTDAEAQKVQADTLSPLFLQKQAIEKWNGQLPEYLGNGTVFNIPLGS